jgi:hypothetical protein
MPPDKPAASKSALCRWLPRQLDIDQLLDEDIQEILLTANLFDMPPELKKENTMIRDAAGRTDSFCRRLHASQ